MQISETTALAHLTRHAAKRMQQRSISTRTVNLFLRYADREKAVGNGLVALTMSGSGVSDLQKQGVLGSEDGSRLARIAVLVDAATEAVVTACWLHGRKSRAYTVGAAWN